MEYTFSHYLLAKQSVDDRALNRHVYNKLQSSLPQSHLRIIEVGAGIGTMLARLLKWGLLGQAEYTLVDEMQENITYAAGWIPVWAGENNFQVKTSPGNHVRLSNGTQDVLIRMECADVFDFIRRAPQPADLLIAHAFLDLLPMPESLRGLFALVKIDGLAWLTINFDGVSTLEPAIDAGLDQTIERLYHQTMDTRPTGGDSQAGRHLFSHLAGLKAMILAAGASDWVVHALNGKYPADESYFLQFILHFYEQSLSGKTDLDPTAFADWLGKRRAQIARGELVYIAHQMDFLVKPPGV